MCWCIIISLWVLADANINLRENGGRRAIDMLNSKSSHRIGSKSNNGFQVS